MTGEDTTHVSGCWEMRALRVYHEGECEEEWEEEEKGRSKINI